VAKLSPDGLSVVYFAILGGSGADSAVALALGADGYATVAGLTSSRLDPSGVVKYATYLDTQAAGIALDTGGDVFVLGSGSPGATGGEKCHQHVRRQRQRHQPRTQSRRRQ
jgi:hypothetical protein